MTQAYPLVLIVGVLAGILWAAYIGSGEHPAFQRATEAAAFRLDACVAGLVGALLSARVAYVATHWGYFRLQPLTSLALWEGGLTGWGAGLGVILGLGGYSLAASRPFWQLADAVAVPATLVVFSGWIGCLLDGCAYGRGLEAGWLTPPSRDLLGQRQPRLPTQSGGALLAAGSLLALVPWARADHPEGTSGLLALALHSLTALGLSLGRADPVPIYAGARSDTLGYAGVALIAVALFALRMSGNLRREE